MIVLFVPIFCVEFKIFSNKRAVIIILYRMHFHEFLLNLHYVIIQLYIDPVNTN